MPSMDEELGRMRAEMDRRLARRPEHCPACGSAELRFIIWGDPVDPHSYLGDDWEKKVALGGCLIPDDGPPEWACAGCGLEFSLTRVPGP